MERENPVQCCRSAARTALFSLICAMASACGDGMGNPQGPSSPYGLYNYLNVNPDVIFFEGDRFFIRDKPQENTMLVTNPWKSLWSDYSLKQWTEIAADYIEQSGRDCVVINTRRIWPGEAEFKYVCE